MSELEYMPNPFYVFSVQPNFSPTMRAVLIDWMQEVCSEFSLQRGTFYLAVACVDRFLSVCPGVRTSKYQMVGLGCLLLAAKFEEVLVPRLDDFLRAAKNVFSAKEVLCTERLILEKLRWRVCGPSYYSVLNGVLSDWDNCMRLSGVVFREQNTRSYSRFRELVGGLDSAILDVRILRFTPRVVACGLLTLFVAREMGCVEGHVLGLLQKLLGLRVPEGVEGCCRVLKEYVGLKFCWERACFSKRLGKSYQEFLSCQTYSKQSLGYAKERIQRYIESL